MRALVVEDDPAVASELVRGMTAAGFVVDLAGDGQQAWFNGDVEEYDVAVVDLGLPRLDGLSVIKRWRDAGRNFPVLILSARGEWTDKVAGIEVGADDYMAKPWAMEELVARLRGLIRRAAGRSSPMLQAGPVRIDTHRMTATLDGALVKLSPLEYRLLDYLAHHAGRAVPATELSDHLYGDADTENTNAIEALIARLRRKLGAGTIETRRGFGYLVPAAAA
ncbi:response regulator transcription factor [Sphingopyxis macrogoltabida]|uniref:Two-component system response regulator n=1 Tax=Sphingopyxis macrogoltabida TaxID=33050 RepID=A0AAC8YZ25_SPHMC|nr:response regulator transcription factor [Sphingopyxis macrogoltabida]ALJ13702.1 transcriptional regulator [Sphingopyxis macrogoltabida]AMU88855.1 two-component system response regulator [Sphingopyxis macrogoltabida]